MWKVKYLPADLLAPPSAGTAPPNHRINWIFSAFYFGVFTRERKRNRRCKKKGIGSRVGKRKGDCDEFEWRIILYRTNLVVEPPTLFKYQVKILFLSLSPIVFCTLGGNTQKDFFSQNSFVGSAVAPAASGPVLHCLVFLSFSSFFCHFGHKRASRSHIRKCVSPVCSLLSFRPSMRVKKLVLYDGPPTRFVWTERPQLRAGWRR